MNQLFFGDNLDVLRESIRDESVDLIYLDPPFNSSATYNVLFSSPKGHESDAQIEAFEDTWHWGPQAEREFDEIMHQQNTQVAEMMGSFRQFLGENDMMAYLTMMANRLLELNRVLKPTGSLYLHCDPTAGHYLKVLLDGVFGNEHFRNEISWHRSGRRSSISKVYRRAHDVILFYTKSDEYTFHLLYEEKDDTLLRKYTLNDERGVYRLVPLMASGKVAEGGTGKPWRGYDPNSRGKAGMHWLTTADKLEAYVTQGLVDFPRKSDGVPQLKYYLEQNKGIPLSDFWDDIDLINSMGSESLGYQTQKPLALLERIVQASSNEGDLVLDPFCGCGTAVHAAQKLNRTWVGIDITHLAISLIEKRLKDAFPEILFEVHGTPKDYEGARNLAERDKYQFQWWATSLVNAQPYQGKKKGADSGIDGLIFFQDEANNVPKKIVVSVKGGENIGVPMVRDLRGTMDRQKAEIGLFVTLNAPTKPMITEAATAGFYTSPTGGKFPRIQLLSIEGLLEGKEAARYPNLDAGALTFRKAQIEHGEDKQRGLFEQKAKPKG